VVSGENDDSAGRRKLSTSFAQTDKTPIRPAVQTRHHRKPNREHIPGSDEGEESECPARIINDRYQRCTVPQRAPPGHCQQHRERGHVHPQQVIGNLRPPLERRMIEATPVAITKAK
jgi:hypothetical protein